MVQAGGGLGSGDREELSKDADLWDSLEWGGNRRWLQHSRTGNHRALTFLSRSCGKAKTR